MNDILKAKPSVAPPTTSDLTNLLAALSKTISDLSKALNPPASPDDAITALVAIMNDDTADTLMHLSAERWAKQIVGNKTIAVWPSPSPTAKMRVVAMLGAKRDRYERVVAAMAMGDWRRSGIKDPLHSQASGGCRPER